VPQLRLDLGIVVSIAAGVLCLGLFASQMALIEH